MAAFRLSYLWVVLVAIFIIRTIEVDTLFFGGCQPAACARSCTNKTSENRTACASQCRGWSKCTCLYHCGKKTSTTTAAPARNSTTTAPARNSTTTAPAGSSTTSAPASSTTAAPASSTTAAPATTSAPA